MGGRVTTDNPEQVWKYSEKLSRPWPVFRATMRSSRNLIFVREEERERETLKFRHSSIFGADLRVPRTLSQMRNHPYVFCPRSLTRAVTNVSLEKYLEWDDILEF